VCLAAQHGGGPWKLKQLRHQMRRRQRLGGRGTDRWRDAAVRRRHDPDLWDDQLVQPVEVLLGKERGVSHGLCYVAQQVLAAVELHHDDLSFRVDQRADGKLRQTARGDNTQRSACWRPKSKVSNVTAAPTQYDTGVYFAAPRRVRHAARTSSARLCTT